MPAATPPTWGAGHPPPGAACDRTQERMACTPFGGSMRRQNIRGGGTEPPPGGGGLRTWVPKV